jgi:polyphosphate kinase 2 (PPK2 family)
MTESVCDQTPQEEAGMKYPKLDLDEYRVSSRARFSLKAIRPDGVQGWDKAAAKARLKENLVAMDELQERLYAEGERALLIVFQAMDAAGKDGIIKAVTVGINPQGCAVTTFKTLERAHDFVWRVHLHAPPKGMIGIFNRSHYEDVLIGAVPSHTLPCSRSRKLAP